MSKLNEIQKKLSEIDATKFHKLVDVYLNKKYKYTIHSTGTKIAEDKPRIGTPDTLITLNNGQYLFVEYTTQKTNIRAKFLEDIEKCFDIKKTNIAIEKIDKIILACNSSLQSEDIEALKQQCGSISCEILTNSTLSYDLNNSFSIIAKDFLGIEVDTGQILDDDDFVKIYDSSKYTTPLDIEFKFREQESKDIFSMIDTSSVVLITGKAGVGKTKLALETGMQYARENKYVFKCILERGGNIFDDIKSYFNDSTPFLIFIDDANRIHTALTYLKEYYSDKLTRGSIKLILTVRDYAKTKVIDNLSKIDFKQIEIKEFTNKEIRELVKSQYDIQNTDYLERIENLSKGNPRLALMIAKIAKEKNTLESINNISNVYDEYFSNIFKESNIVDDTLKVAAIISFFRVVDKSNETQMDLICNVFKIDTEAFWKHAHELHEQELCDFYENEVVKISDQVVSTYLFYNCVFQKKLLNINVYILNLFFDYPKRMNDVLIPMMHSFNMKEIQKELQPAIDELWTNNISHKENIMLLMKYFWYIKETNTLIYCKNYVNFLEEETIDIDNYEFVETNDFYQDNDLLVILSRFINSYDSFKMALQLILEYFERQPSTLKGFMLPLLTKTCSYSLESHKDGYHFENILLDELWEKSQKGKNILTTKLYLEVVKYYLKIEVDTCRSQGKYAISFIPFSIYKTKELEILREKIWKNIFKLYKTTKYKNRVINVINKYITDIQHLRVNKANILEFDSLFLLSFIDENFSPVLYTDCKMVQKYLRVLKSNKIVFSTDMYSKFLSETYQISKILDIDKFYYIKKYDDLSGEEIETIHKNELKDFIQKYKNIDDWKKLLESIEEIIRTSNSYNINESINILLRALAEKDKTLFVEVVKLYLIYKEMSPQCHNVIIVNLIAITGKDKTYSLLDLYCVTNKECWLFSYYSCLLENLIESSDVDGLLKLYTEVKEYVPYHFGFLEKYLLVDKDIVYKVSKILYDKSFKNEYLLKGFMALFNSNTNLNNNLLFYFKHDIPLLKKIYSAYDKYSTHGDYHCKTLNKILDVDPSFIIEYIQCYLDDKDGIDKINYHKDMQILWKRNDYKQIVNLIIETYFKHNTKHFSRDNELLFLFTHAYHNEKIEIEEIQKQFLIEYIEKNSEDMEKIKYIFELISNFSDKQKKEFIFIFIENNITNESIHEIIKEPSSCSWSGSAVVYWNERKEYYESLLELFTNDIKYIEHKQYVEGVIKNYECRIISEKKREFMDD